ncbi:hypothetical protein ACXU77_05635 [Vibrio parahaemolyticus]|uniref:hypothetical protein n=1 Tax=Vibrio parahaemolyticus TaxID=670 RepID=UPI002F33A365|nr:hypothetical protein [Vibrio parahaemolyticus]
MRVDNNGLEEMVCPSCSKTDLVVTNELFFKSEHLNVDFECTSCNKEYERDYEALIAGFNDFNDCEDFPHLPQEEFNLNEDEEGERFEIGTCYNCGSKDVWESGDPFFGDNYVSETYTCDDCDLETYVEFYDCDGFNEIKREENDVEM